MKLILEEDNFVNGKYTVQYGDNMEAMFTIVDEEFQGNSNIGRINKITILVRQLNNDGTLSSASLQSSVIGIGNGVVGVMSSDSTLRGKIFNKDNMTQCTVLLYEDGVA